MNDSPKPNKFIPILMSAVAIVAVIFIVIIALYVKNRSTAQSFQATGKSAEAMMALAKNELETQLHAFEEPLNLLSEMYADPDHDSVMLNELTAEILHQNAAIESAFVYFKDISCGTYMFESDSGWQAISLTEKMGVPILDEMLRERHDQIFWKMPEWEEVAQKVSTTVWKPILRQQNQVGLVGFHLAMDTFFSDFETFNSLQTNFFVLSEEGFLLTPLADFYPKGVSLYEMIKAKNQPQLMSVAKLIMNGESGMMQPVRLSDHSLHYLNFIHIPEAHISLCMLIDEALIFDHVRSMNRKVWLLLLTGMVVLLLLIYLFLRKRIRFLKEMSDSIDVVGKGIINTMLPDIDTRDEFSQLHDHFHQMQEHLTDYCSQLVSKTRQEEQQELVKQQNIFFQKHFLLQDYRKFAFGNSGTCELKIKYHPAKILSGDFYDYFFLNEHQFCFLLGNVDGNSTLKSNLMAFLMSTIREELHAKHSLARFAENLNNHWLTVNEEQRNIKLLMAVLDSESKTMNFVNIGYELLYLIRDQIVINIESVHGLAVGVVADACFTSSTLGLHDGDVLFFSDMTVPNMLNKSGSNYSKERLEQLLSAQKTETPVNLLNHIADDVDHFIKGIDRSKDYTMLAMKLFEK